MIAFSAAWRAEALSLVFQSRPSSQTFTLEPNIIPSLTQLCLGELLSECTTQEFYDLVPCLPVHLRLELVRYAAIHCPLSSSKLRALLGTDGHADGELLVIGPSASSVHFRQTRATVSALQGESVDWDMEDSTPNPLQSLIIVSNRLAMSTVLTFPPTITHLALINLENPIPLHQLPALCPLLLFLDLSYNLWLTNMSVDTLKSIERVDWSRWSQLKTLGWRECFIPDGMLDSLNKRRWDDVEVMY
ncbi:hypothetical protein BT96DRAFT_848244 [Gymnopus androsaceus JB14]|uniref:F-box domain-containing protein n=1 Tax=Gymnopus androsaceus JB14 TaxID=1447944 RepID=A0A6A4IMC9_9AGAR|nr:hypothetical protein BT96DRAFT_848244 [Gymnopus androsaceus JB14]